MPTTKPRDKGELARTRKFVAKQDAILDAAAREFNRRGLKGATFADIAGSVGLLTNSVTYYYRRKDDLAAACLLKSIDTGQALAVAALSAGNPEARIRRLIHDHAELLAGIASGRCDQLVNFNDIRALKAPEVDHVFAAYTEMFRSIRRLLPKETLQPQQRNARAHLLLSLLHWMRRWISRYEPEDYVHAAACMSDIVINGLASRRKQWREPAQPDIGWPQPAAGDATTPEAFLRAATILLNDQGYRGVSVDRIAARLNLTKGSFYHHYDSKEELVAACFERTFAVIRRTQALARERHNTGWERLTAAARAQVRIQLSDQGPLLRTSAWNALPEETRKDSMRGLDRLIEQLGMFVVQAIREGDIPTLDPAIAAQQVAGMINAASELDRWVPRLAGDQTDVDLFVRPLFEGILS
ncbi:TetR/AcrR family transcriptional regulator [Bradyrhizobium prioriisuperbiae]|uniref:TetR/AcrR family transcriptional regulator n=1 Tax=Bradyrhizobium prioriisuperbiae TaxID=2854389 RepID=UPI0028E7ED8E|nr:TetR/AcrR family transcriptional regulator [Bradyrhizobium prioritasuperba]